MSTTIVPSAKSASKPKRRRSPKGVLGSDVIMNPKRERFCQLYVSEKEFIGNGTQAYLEAFGLQKDDPGSRRTAAVNASKLLKDPECLRRINYLLEEYTGMNDANADKQLAFLMAQFSDLRVKLSAIRTYNDLKGRIKTKIELDFSNKTDAELDAEIAEITLQISEAEAVVNGEQESPQGNLYVVPRSIAEVNDGTEA